MPVGVRTKNGRLYSREVVQKAIDEAPHPLLIQKGLKQGTMSDLCGTVGEVTELKIEGNKLVAECEFVLPTFRQLVRDGFARVAIAGSGRDCGGGVVAEYALSYLFLSADCD